MGKYRLDEKQQAIIDLVELAKEQGEARFHYHNGSMKLEEYDIFCKDVTNQLNDVFLLIDKG